MQIIAFLRDGMKEPASGPVSARVVNFDKNNLDDLLLVAKYRVVHFPTFIVIDERGKVLLRMHSPIPSQYLDNLAGSF